MQRPTPIAGDGRPAEDALLLLRALSESHGTLDRARYTLAAAYLMTSPSLEDAQRLLEVVDECHAERGIDLHDAFGGRAT